MAPARTHGARPFPRALIPHGGQIVSVFVRCQFCGESFPITDSTTAGGHTHVCPAMQSPILMDLSAPAIPIDRPLMLKFAPVRPDDPFTLPARTHPGDAGLDLFVAEHVTIYPHAW